MGTNKLMAWKPEGASPDSAAVLMAIALALAVFAAGMTSAGYDSVTGARAEMTGRRPQRCPLP